MATRQDVVNAIETIENNGNNTAKEVRDVLNMLLDYTENEESNSEHTHFRLESKNKLEDRRGAHFWYSLDGFKGYSVNFTMKIHILEDNLMDPKFKLEPKVYKTLREIVKTDQLCFSVGVHQSPKSSTHMTLFMSLKTKNQIEFLLTSRTKTKNNDKVFTSIQLHAPENFGR